MRRQPGVSHSLLQSVSMKKRVFFLFFWKLVVQIIVCASITLAGWLTDDKNASLFYIRTS